MSFGPTPESNNDSGPHYAKATRGKQVRVTSEVHYNFPLASSIFKCYHKIMNDNKNDKKPALFGLGVIVGTILGGLAAFFLAPKSGKENREAVMKKVKQLKKDIEAMELDKKVKEVWGDVTEDGKKTFMKAKKNLFKKLDELQNKWEGFDREKYMKMVEDSVENAKEGTKDTAEKLIKLKELFVRDWPKV